MCRCILQKPWWFYTSKLVGGYPFSFMYKLVYLSNLLPMQPSISIWRSFAIFNYWAAYTNGDNEAYRVRVEHFWSVRMRVFADKCILYECLWRITLAYTSIIICFKNISISSCRQYCVQKQKQKTTWQMNFVKKCRWPDVIGELCFNCTAFWLLQIYDFSALLSEPI